jgi:hypothetical protein
MVSVADRVILGWLSVWSWVIRPAEIRWSVFAEAQRYIHRVSANRSYGVGRTRELWQGRIEPFS